MMRIKVPRLASRADVCYNRTIVRCGVLRVLEHPQDRYICVGDAPMDTVPHHGLNNNLKPFYVYTLAYPESMGGAIFYVGKGKGNRIDMHEVDAREHKHVDNPLKLATIREIWACGEEVTKRKVAEFENEMDAYMYEWALMNMTAYAYTLTNVSRGGGFPYYIKSPHIAKIRVPEKAYKYHCSGCGKNFASNSAHASHRKGNYLDGTRRCLTTEELLARGFITEIKKVKILREGTLYPEQIEIWYKPLDEKSRANLTKLRERRNASS